VSVTQIVVPRGPAPGRHVDQDDAVVRAAGARHDVVNANPYEFVFVEIELKTPTLAPGGAR